MNADDRALQLDAEDPLRHFREKFVLPQDKIYLCSHSLGLPPRSAFSSMQEQMQRWADKGASNWAKGENSWYTLFEDSLKKPLAHLLGAQEDEVVVMNSITVNLHLLMTSFYQPKESRYKILIDAPTFPSDLYALKSHIRLHGFDPDQALLIVEPRVGEYLLREEDLEEAIVREGESLALVYVNPVNFLTGQVIDTAKIAALTHAQGALIGVDIAHAAGNIPLHLHKDDIDFAVGCSYKYLCSGPGGPGLAFVHARHHGQDLPRLSGWWGNDPATRFQMHLQPKFIPHGGASSYQVSTPSILAMTPFIASLEVMEEAGLENMRKKSMLQTTFLLELLEQILSRDFTVITPKDPLQRGCQVSLLIHEQGEAHLRSLQRKGIVADFRPPTIIRVAPSPLYTSFQEVLQFAREVYNTISQVKK